MRSKSNGKPFDIVNYIFHLKHLKNISNRRNLYPVFPLKLKLTQSKEYNEEEKRIFNELKANNRIIKHIKSKNLSPFKIKTKSQEFIDQMYLCRKLEENKLKNQIEDLKARFITMKRINNRNNKSFIFINSHFNSQRKNKKSKVTLPMI